MTRRSPPALADRTLPKVLLGLAECDPDIVMLRTADASFRRGEVVASACRVAADLADLGVDRGSPVAVMMPNRPEFLFSWFACGLLGAVQVPINPAEAGHRLVHVLNHSQAVVAIVDSSSMSALDEVAPELTHLRHVIVVESPSVMLGHGIAVSAYPLGEHAREVPPAALRVDVADPAAVLYTSGSTGPAKGVVVSHGHHVTNGLQPAGLFDLSSSDVVYVCLPLHHNMAQGYGVWPALVSGASIALDAGFRSSTFLASVRTHRATVLPFVGAMLALIAKLPDGPDDSDNQLRVGYGIPVPAGLHESIERRFGFQVAHCYGSTEATIVAWGVGADRVPGAAGRILPDYDVLVADEHDEPVADGESGEICVRPRLPFSMFSEYYRDAERTVRCWRNLWFHTGDRGYFDSDGRLWFADRIGDGIRRLGEFVSSYDVEQAILAHPDVRLVAALAVPSDLIEEEVLVLAVIEPGSDLTPGELRRWCTTRLPRHAVPRYVEFVADVPLTATGKIEKFKLRQRGVVATTDDARATRQLLDHDEKEDT